MDNKDIINKMITAQEKYNKIINKEIYYFYEKDGHTKWLMFKPMAKHFRHLCGIEYKNPKNNRNVSATQFYSLVKRKQLSPEGIIIKNDGTSIQKLEVIGQIDCLITKNIRILDGNISFYNFSFYKGIRTSKAIFCLALEQDRSHDYFIPLSLLNLKKEQNDRLRKSHEVKCIFTRDLNGVVECLYSIEKYIGMTLEDLLK